MINGVVAECYLGPPSSTLKHSSSVTWQLSPLYSDTSDAYRCSWNKTDSTRWGGGGGVVIITNWPATCSVCDRAAPIGSNTWSRWWFFQLDTEFSRKMIWTLNLRWVLQNVLICRLITSRVIQGSNLSMTHASKLQHHTSCSLLGKGPILNQFWCVSQWGSLLHF